MFTTEESGGGATFWGDFTSFWGEHWPVLIEKIVAIVVIVAIALLIRWVLHFVIDRIVTRVVTGVKRKQAVTDTQALQASPLAAVRVVQRTRTLGSVLSNIVNLTLFIISLLLIVMTINPEILSSFALLTAAIGAGLGFGAQNIVKDSLNGIFMVVEDQLGVGDIVDLGPATGIVEEVRIRVTKIRDVNGTVWFVRNGEVTRVGNMTQGWARVIIDLSLPYEVHIHDVESALLESAVEFAHASKWRSRVLERPEVWGLESVADDALVVRVVMKVRSSAKDDVARELRMRLKRTIDELDIRPITITSVVPTGFDGATRVKGSKQPNTAPHAVLAATAAAKRSKAAKAAKAPKTRSPEPAPTTPGAGAEASTDHQAGEQT